jgi:hypothetical protein
MGISLEDLTGDSKLTKCIEDGVVKKGNKTYIPDSALANICSSLQQDTTTIIFGNNSNFDGYIKEIFFDTAINIKQIETTNLICSYYLIQQDDQILKCTNAITECLFFRGEFSKCWYEAKIQSLNDSSSNYISLNKYSTELWLKTIEDLYNFSKEQIEKSFRNTFLSDYHGLHNFISLKNFNYRITTWINHDLIKIITGENSNLHKNRKMSLGFQVKEIMNEVYEQKLKEQRLDDRIPKSATSAMRGKDPFEEKNWEDDFKKCNKLIQQQNIFYPLMFESNKH